jgi:AraC-like DNA-binding protein
MARSAEREPTTLGTWCATLVRALDHQGLDGRALAAEAGISGETLLEADARVPRSALTRLWDLAVERTGDSAFGLVVARHTMQTSLHALGYAVFASTSLVEAFHRLIRFRRMIGDVIELSLEPRGESYEFIIDVSKPPGAPLAAVDAIVAMGVRVARTLRGDPQFCPSAVSLQRPEQGKAEVFRRSLGVPVQFSQARNVIEYPRPPFEERLSTGNAELARQNDEVAARYLARLEQAGIARRVREILLEVMPTGAPRKQLVAKKLAMSQRNLQRYLTDEGTSFNTLLNDVRESLARSYVADGRRSMTEIAFLLGFADTSTFSRAFKRWTGKAPTDFGRQPESLPMSVTSPRERPLTREPGR